MQQDINVPHEISPFSPPTGGTRAWIAGLGAMMVVMPCLQAYLAVKPLLNISDFLPASMVMEQIVSMLQVWNASAIAGTLMAVGGILLMVGKWRWGWILGVASLGFAVFNVLETLVLTLAPNFNDPKTLAFIWEFGLELLGMTYYAPVMIVVIEVVALVALLRRARRVQFGLARTQYLIAAAIFVVLLIDLHLSLYIYYLSNQP